MPILTLSLDDFHPQSSPYDFGGLNGVVLYRIQHLVHNYKIKLNLFTVPNWQDVPHNQNQRIGRLFDRTYQLNDEPFLLTKHTEWTEVVKKLIDEKKIELSIHGYTHHNNIGGLHQQEFINLDYAGAVSHLKKAMEIFSAAKLQTSKIFKPSGYGYNSQVLRALTDLGFEAIAPYSSRKLISGQTKLEGLKVPPQNARIDEILTKNGDVHLVGHLCYNYGNEIIKDGIENDLVWETLKTNLENLDGYESMFLSEVLE